MPKKKRPGRPARRAPQRDTQLASVNIVGLAHAVGSGALSDGARRTAAAILQTTFLGDRAAAREGGDPARALLLEAFGVGEQSIDETIDACRELVAHGLVSRDPDGAYRLVDLFEGQP